MVLNALRRIRFFGRLILLPTIFILIFMFASCSTPRKTYRVGVLCGLDFFANTIDGFKIKMSELGYIEGQEITYDIQYSKSDMVVASNILNKFIAEKVDCIFVLPTDVSVTAKELTRGTNIPVLFANANIEDQGLVKSIREPGENITGVRYPGPDITLKRFEIMLELVPHIKRLWVPYRRNLPIVPRQLSVLRPAAAAAGITLVESPAENAEELEDILRQTQRKKLNFDAILMIAEPLVVSPKSFIVLGKFAAEHNIPLGGSLMSINGYESIFGISTDNIAVGKQAALLANKILKGTPAGSIPVVSAENYLEINYRAAQRFEIKISDGLLKQADKVIR